MKTEKATPHRLKEQGKKGKSFNSKDALIWLVLFVGVVVLCFGTSLEPVMDLFRTLVATGFSIPPTEFVRLAAIAGFKALAPVFVAVVACIVLISLVQSRGIVAFAALKPDLSKLNPISGFKNLFTVRVIKDLVRSCIYLVLTGVAGVVIWKQVAREVLMQGRLAGMALAPLWMDVLWRAGAQLLLWFLPVALLAAVAELLIFLRDMKMDKNEVKQEHKDQEGNPEIKNKRKQINEELSEQMKANVAGSDVILANPTHIAVGLWLHSEIVPMPFVTIHEKGSRARAVIAYAEKIGIPVVRDIRLARGLFKRTRRYGFVVGDDVAPVVRLLRWLRDVQSAGEAAPDDTPSNDMPPSAAPPVETPDTKDDGHVVTNTGTDKEDDGKP